MYCLWLLLSIAILSVAAFVLQGQNRVVVTENVWLLSLKYLLSDPLRKMFTNPWCRLPLLRQQSPYSDMTLSIYVSPFRLLWQKYHWLGGLHYTNVFSQFWRVGNPRKTCCLIWFLAHSFPGLQKDAFLLSPHMIEREIISHVSLLLKVLSPFMRALPKAPPPNIITYWELGN